MDRDIPTKAVWRTEMAKAKMTSRTKEVIILNCTACFKDLTACYRCGHTFNRDNEQIVCDPRSNRHYHKECA